MPDIPERTTGGTWYYVSLIGGPVLAGIAGLICWGVGLDPKIAWTVVVTVLCAVWWVFEPLPIPATSLIPFVAFPLTGVVSHKVVASSYGHTLVLLLLGGFILSTAMERSGAHRRLALGMVRLFGGSDRRLLVAGFMAAAAVLSMWISNTATTLMLLPIAMAVLDQDDDGKLSVPLLLGIAYAASIGGLGTPVGTPPNVIFMGIYSDRFGDTVSFAEWMTWGVPAVVLMLPLAWFVVTRGLTRGDRLEVPTPGPWRPSEIVVLVIFSLTALAWITLKDPFGGWSGLLGLVDEAGKPLVGDATVALFFVVACFIVPNFEGGRVLDWKTATRIPWGLLLLFGGGIALAKAFDSSGLSALLGHQLEGMSDWSTVLMVWIICLTVTFLTEFTSNTATTSLLMPILATVAQVTKVDPPLLMVPATLSASCAFMMPVATAPNAIMFGTGKLPLHRMVTRGIWLNLAGSLVLTALCMWILG